MEIPDSFTVDVTAEDIETGRPRNCYLCPVALALTRTYTQQSWDVDSTMAYGDCTPYRHDGGAFINAFDDHGRVKPCTITFHMREPRTS